MQLLKPTFVLLIESSWSGVKVEVSTYSYLFLLVLFLYIYLEFSSASSSSVILAHAALKWLHSFVLSLDRNPLDIVTFAGILSNLQNARNHSPL